MDIFFFFEFDNTTETTPISADEQGIIPQKVHQEEYSESLFESIKHINDYGQEFWYARELQIALEYKRWDKFKNVIDKAIVACENSSVDSSDHFPTWEKSWMPVPTVMYLFTASFYPS